MAGIAVKLPLSIDARHGPYSLHTRLKPMIKQNLKMLLLTIPGERVMDPDFGVGVQKFLFEQDTIDLRSHLAERISNQVMRYMPFLKIREAILPSLEDMMHADRQKIGVIIRYSIEDLSEEDVLNISMSPYDSSQTVF